MVSVIVPVYNVEKYLYKCVESIKNQTYKNLEIILVDDGSLDDSSCICDEIAKKDERIIVIHKENGGLSSARNAGLEKATGEYITFVDSDDYICPDAIRTMLDAIQRMNTDMAMCSSVLCDESGKKLAKDQFKDQYVYIGSEIVTEFILPLKTAVWNKLFRSSFIGNTKFPNGRIHGEDLFFLTQCLHRKTTLVTVSYIGYCYIKHSGSITMGKFSERAFDEIYCKDVSYDTLVKRFPEYCEKAIIWRFRARMNILRKLVLNRLIEYDNKKVEYTRWILKYYSIIKKELSWREKVEYLLYIKIPNVYYVILQIKFR